MEAVEKLTFDQVNKMVKNHIQKRIKERTEERGETDYYTKMSIEHSIYKIFFELLIEKDPTDVACKLYFAERRFLITRFNSPEDIQGEVIREHASESCCDYSLQELRLRYPERTFVKSVKITER
jgi:hypothetical protein